MKELCPIEPYNECPDIENVRRGGCLIPMSKFKQLTCLKEEILL